MAGRAVVRAHAIDKAARTVPGCAGLVLGFALCLACLQSGSLLAQAQPPPAAQAPAAIDSLTAALSAEPSGEPFTLTFFNRPIVVLRARVVGRLPIERAAGAARILDDLAAQGTTGPVESRPLERSSLISVGSRGVLALTSPDIDELAGETLEGVTAQTVARLQQALNEAAEARAPRRLLRSAAAASAALVLAILALWGLARAHRFLAGKLEALAERELMKAGVAPLETLRASRLLDVQRHGVTAVITAIDLVLIYGAAGFVLRQFPYTRPWGESMRGFLLATASDLGLGMVHAVPGLFTVLLILVITRFIVRLIGVWLGAIQQGRVRGPRWIHPETAQPTRRLLTGLSWLFAIVVAYPYLPGSETDAFKGVSVFLGLMVTLGSSGLVNHIMSGFMITYSRAVRVGDFVRIGDVEGTVSHLGVLSIKVRTLQNEEVTIPNAVMVGQTTTDYSRLGETDGVFTPTSVTIGYDAPWRQVRSLLLQAADRTPGLRRDPKPFVSQTALEDFYVKYTLFVCLERQQSRLVTLDALHAHIQDVFNEYGVQIMSPNYVLDPAAPKIVAKKDWFTAPARPDPPSNQSS
jgi:small-conductance mechanosensitive channel